MGKFIAALFIIAPNWKQPKCPSIGEWINKLGHLWNEMVFINKMKWITNACNNTDGSQMHYFKWNKPHSKKPQTVCFHYIIFQKRQNYKDKKKKKKSRGSQRLGVEKVYWLEKNMRKLFQMQKCSLSSLCRWLHNCMHLFKVIILYLEIE